MLNCKQHHTARKLVAVMANVSVAMVIYDNCMDYLETLLVNQPVSLFLLAALLLD